MKLGRRQQEALAATQTHAGETVTPINPADLPAIAARGWYVNDPADDDLYIAEIYITDDGRAVRLDCAD